MAATKSIETDLPEASSLCDVYRYQLLLILLIILKYATMPLLVHCGILKNLSS